MKKVIVASENPVKIEVAKLAFATSYPNEEFEFIAVKSESGVPDQPREEETELGAFNRLDFKRKNIQKLIFGLVRKVEFVRMVNVYIIVPG